uniref:Uncharacterized protein n=1 Tax=Anopheles farauti TaxID=69004 RepID=A0A182QVF2_9DIPT
MNNAFGGGGGGGLSRHDTNIMRLPVVAHGDTINTPSAEGCKLRGNSRTGTNDNKHLLYQSGIGRGAYYDKIMAATPKGTPRLLLPVPLVLLLLLLARYLQRRLSLSSF